MLFLFPYPSLVDENTHSLSLHLSFSPSFSLSFFLILSLSFFLILSLSFSLSFSFSPSFSLFVIKVLDQPNAESDRRLGRHLVSLYYNDDTQLQAQQARAGNVDQVRNFKCVSVLKRNLLLPHLIFPVLYCSSHII